MENKEMAKPIINMLMTACKENQWETARFLLKQLESYGFHYATQENHAVFKLNSTVYRVPLETVKEDIPDFAMPDMGQEAVPTARETPSANPWENPVSDSKPLQTAEPDSSSDSADAVFNELFGSHAADGKSEEEKAWGTKESTGNVDDELDALLKGLGQEVTGIIGNSKADEPAVYDDTGFSFGEISDDEKKSPSFESLTHTPAVHAAANIPTVEFSRKDADAAPERTPGHKFTRAEASEEKPAGFMPPLTGEIAPNTEIALSDCVYSIFLADIYEESSIMKQKIFFMVAPFEVSEDTPSANIFMYAYMDGKNYSSNSLKNPNKNSLYCQIGPYEFFIRGWLKDGKWQSEIKLAGNSLTRHDIFEITNVMHFSPETLGKTNGHIRFRYKGFVNHKNIESLGCVNIFPIDPNTKDFVMIRCIEDFMDVFYSTDEGKVMELQTTEGVKEVRAVCDEYGICRAVITDKPKEEEEAMIQ